MLGDSWRFEIFYLFEALGPYSKFYDAFWPLIAASLLGEKS